MDELRDILRKFKDDGINFSYTITSAPKVICFKHYLAEKDTQEKCNTLINQA